MGHTVEKTYAGMRRTTARLRLFVALSLVAGTLGAGGWLSGVTLSGEAREHFGRYLYVSYLVANEMDDEVEFTIDGQRYRGRPRAWREALARDLYETRSATEVLAGPLWAGGVAGVATLAALVLWGWSSRVDGGDRNLRGASMSTREDLRRAIVLGPARTRLGRILKWGAGEPGDRTLRARVFRRAMGVVSMETLARLVKVELGIDVGGVRVLKEDEQSHVMILGDSGAGKTSLMRWMMLEVRKRGEPAVIYDPEGEFLQTFFCPGDTVLNPVDGRMPNWSPRVEIASRAVAEGIAESFVPEMGGSHNRFWTDSARTLFVDLLLTTDSLEPRELAEACALPLDQLAARLKGTAAAAALSPGAAQMAESVRGTLMVATRGLALLEKPLGYKTWFSLRDWALKPSGWIFLTRTKEVEAATRPLITAWLDILLRGLLSRPIGSDQVWVFADEVQTLGRMGNLVELYTQGRKRGVCGVVGSQSYTDFKANYGERAATFISQASTKVIYRCSEPELAKWASDLVGSVERVGYRASVRADLGRGGDSTTLSEERRIEPLLLPSQLKLENHKAFFLFRNMVCPLEPRFTRSLHRVPPFIPRPVFDENYREPEETQGPTEMTAANSRSQTEKAESKTRRPNASDKRQIKAPF